MNASNPYQSPDSPAQTADAARRLTPGRLTGMGAFAGAFWGASAGAVAGVCLGMVFVLSVTLVQPGGMITLEGGIVVLVSAATAGALAGTVAGAVVGAILGLITGLNSEPFRRPLFVLGTVLGSLAGGGFGGLTGWLLYLQPPAADLETLAWVVLGGGIGAITGAAGAGATARVLANTAWATPGRDPVE